MWKCRRQPAKPRSWGSGGSKLVGAVVEQAGVVLDRRAPRHRRRRRCAPRRGSRCPDGRTGRGRGGRCRPRARGRGGSGAPRTGPRSAPDLRRPLVAGWTAGAVASSRACAFSHSQSKGCGRARCGVWARRAGACSRIGAREPHAGSRALRRRKSRRCRVLSWPRCRSWPRPDGAGACWRQIGGRRGRAPVAACHAPDRCPRQHEAALDGGHADQGRDLRSRPRARARRPRGGSAARGAPARRCRAPARRTDPPSRTRADDPAREAGCGC